MSKTAAPGGAATGWRRLRTVAVAVVVVGLLLTGVASWATFTEAHEERGQRLDIVAQQSRAAVQRQMNSYAEALFGLRNLFALNPGFNRTDFHDAVTTSGILRRFPGAHALSFVRAVPAVERLAYEARIKADINRTEPAGIDFTVHPPSSSTELFVVEYAEPVAANEVVLGYDLGSDPVRRTAAEEARDSGDVTATAPVQLVSGGQPGFLLFLAVYDTRSVPVTSPARRRHFLGLVSATFQVSEMFEEVLGTGVRQEIEIFDVGRTVDPPAGTLMASQLVFDADRRLDVEENEAGLRRGALDLDVGSRRWRLLVFPRPGFGGTNEEIAWIVMMVGVLLTVLVSGLVFAFGRSRRLAVGLAAEMTASLRERERELEETNQRLALANEQLSLADQAKTAFLSTISHELQTPLTSIRGFSDLLIGDRHLGKEAHEYANRIARNATALSNLIHELLEFSHLDRGEVSLSRQPLPLSEFVPRVVDQLGPVLDGYGVQLEIEPGVVAGGDPDAVTRILTNLLANAAKFSPAGSAVRVSVTSTETHAVVRVTDEGPGIAEEERDRVFDRFYRGQRPEVAETRGTGIGLAVVKELTERMGGSVSVENRSPAGAGFVVTLPRA